MLPRNNSTTSELSINIDPRHIQPEDVELMRYFLEFKFNSGIREIAADVAYELTEVEQGLLLPRKFTHLILDNDLFIRLTHAPGYQQEYPQDFTCDVYHKNIFLVAKDCELRQVIGSLEINNRVGLPFKSKIFYCIDPLEMKSGTAKLLRKILNQDFAASPQFRFITAQDLFSCPEFSQDPETPFNVRSKRILLRYLCSAMSDPAEHSNYHYEVYSDNRLGTGKFGAVDAFIGKLNCRGKESLEFVSPLLNDNSKKTAGKLQLLSDENFVRNEVKLTKQATEPSVKPPVFINSSSVIIMGLVQGQSLRKFLDIDRQDLANQKNRFSIDLRLKMIISSLRTYIKKIRGNHLTHRDLNHSNVMFELNNPVKAVFVDHGLSVGDVDDGERGLGSFLVSAPECLNNERVTTESIVFNFGWLIFEILRGDETPCKTKEEALIYNAEIDAKVLNSLHPFQGISNAEFNKEYKEECINILCQMFKPKPSERCTLDEVLKKFESIQFERIYGINSAASNLPPNIFASVKGAHTQGVELRTKLYEFAYCHESIPSSDKLDEMLKIITKYLLRVQEGFYSVREFIEASDIEAFIGLEPKKDNLENTAISIVQAYKSNLCYVGELLKIILNDQAALLQDRSLEGKNKRQRLIRAENKLKRLLRETAVRPHLDILVKLNRKFDKQLASIRGDLDNIHLSLEQDVGNMVSYEAGVRTIKPSIGLNFYELSHSGKLPNFTVSSPGDAAKSHIHDVTQNTLNNAKMTGVTLVGLFTQANHAEATDRFSPNHQNNSSPPPSLILQAP